MYWEFEISVQIYLPTAQLYKDHNRRQAGNLCPASSAVGCLLPTVITSACESPPGGRVLVKLEIVFCADRPPVMEPEHCNWTGPSGAQV